MAYKTLRGVARAVDRMVATLESGRIDDDREYRDRLRAVKSLHRELGGLWSNPADDAEAKTLANRLSDAWNLATS